MQSFYKYLIIGAGPAGMACAISLRKKGEDPLVLDKEKFPRKKTCGGLVTEKTYRLYRMLLGKERKNLAHIFRNASFKARIYLRDEELAQSSFKYPLRFVSREEFDYELVRVYKKTGGNILESCGEYSIDYTNSRILFEDGRRIDYKYLVFADGAFSQSRKLLPVELTDLAFGLSARIPKEIIPEKDLQLRFGYIDHGYLWVIPFDDTVSVGLKADYKKGAGYRKILLSFLQENGVDKEEISLDGAFLPDGVPVQQELLPENVMLVGDAAGFADPISGEGLYFALLSGITAAGKLAFSEDPKTEYLNDLKPVIRLIREGRSLQKHFYSPFMKNYFIRHVRGNARFVRDYFDHMVSEYRYSYQKILRFYLDYKLDGRKKNKK